MDVSHDRSDGEISGSDTDPASRSEAAAVAAVSARRRRARRARSILGQLSVRARLVILLGLVAVPVIIVAVLDALERYRDDLQADRQMVGLLAEVVLREQATALTMARQTLTVLTESRDLRSPVDATFCRGDLLRAAQSMGSQYGTFFLLGPSGRLICDTLGTARDIDLASLGVFKATRENPGVAVDALASDPLTRRPAIVVALPIRLRDGAKGMIGVSVHVQGMGGVPGYGVRPETAVWIVRPGTPTVISIVGGNALLPDWPPAAFAAAARAPVMDGATRDGTPAFYALRRLAGDVHVLVGSPAAESIAAAQASLAESIAQIALYFVLSVVAVTLGAHYSVLKPLRTLGRALSQYGGAAAPFVPPPQLASMPRELRRLGKRFIAVTEAVTDRENRLTDLIEQRDLLVREMHHRVKNNLQIVSSLLNLQAQRIKQPDARAELYSARERVRALSLLHRHLYLQQEVQTIDFRSFLGELVEQMSGLLEESQRQRVAIEIDAPTIRLSSDQSVPLGLIVTEVMTNAFKHGFPDGRRGSIRIALEVRGEEAELVVSNDGLNAAPTVAEGKSDGLGDVLIAGFARQLGGTLEKSAADGAFVLRLTFPLQAAAQDG
ncbi:MAG: sensor histidine kinase [Alphaproteobacteria bacterium]|nr:sensor histidine kinase [Alphaproteobacteria bacterium]